MPLGTNDMRTKYPGHKNTTQKKLSREKTSFANGGYCCCTI